jgi:D-arabinose 1-dehydrogenase-like Zn-dependent alcohol dehydrogenase
LSASLLTARDDDVKGLLITDEERRRVNATMRAARMHAVGEPMVIEDVPLPTPTGADVRVRVHSCNIVPNLANILANWTTWFPQNPLPSLPAIFGLDPAGVVDAVGPDVVGFAPADRVYVNPGRSCGGCPECRRGAAMHCQNFAFAGYFGLTPTSRMMLDRYPYGGLAEYLLAPHSSLVRLPDSLSFHRAARFGYLGTGYAALAKAGLGPGRSLLINGISGTLGLGIALFALAQGVTTILGTGRNRDLLERVRAIGPSRIQVFSTEDGPIDEWVRKMHDGGVDGYISALGPNTPHQPFLEGLRSLRRGGRAVNVGATAGDVPIDVHHMMDQQQSLIGSCWFSAGEGQEMAALAGTGAVDLTVFEDVVFELDEVNEAINGLDNRNGGFSNYIVSPSADRADA